MSKFEPFKITYFMHALYFKFWSTVEPSRVGRPLSLRKNSTVM